MKVLRASCEEDLVGVRPLTQGVDAVVGKGSGVEVPNTLSADRSNVDREIRTSSSPP